MARHPAGLRPSYRSECALTQRTLSSSGEAYSKSSTKTEHSGFQFRQQVTSLGPQLGVEYDGPKRAIAHFYLVRGALGFDTPTLHARLTPRRWVPWRNPSRRAVLLAHPRPPAFTSGRRPDSQRNRSVSRSPPASGRNYGALPCANAQTDMVRKNTEKPQVPTVVVQSISRRAVHLPP